MKSVYQIAALVVAIVAGVTSGLLVPVYWSPRLAYDAFESDTIFGPEVQEDVARMMYRRMLSSMIEQAKRTPPKLPSAKPGEDKAKQALDVMLRWQRDMIKNSLRPREIFPDKYYRIRIRNVGRRPATDVSVVLKVPGVVVEKHVTKGNLERSSRVISVFDKTVPVGLAVDKRELQDVRPQEEVVIEVWYAKQKVGAELEPRWPEALALDIQAECGKAKEVQIADAQFPVWPLLLAAGATVAALLYTIFALRALRLDSEAALRRRPREQHPESISAE